MTQLLPALAAYVPHDRVVNLIAQQPLTTDGVAMIADISGFTPLTEALTQGLSADHGAEELTRALDSVFTPLIVQIHRYRGSVLKFSGDALILWFGREKRGRRTAVIHRALTAAWQMQQVIAAYGQIPTPIGTVTLKMKIGLTYGPVQRLNLGLPEFGFEDVLIGSTLERMAENEHHANPGEILLDAATAVAVSPLISITEWRDDVGVLDELHRASPPKPWPDLAWASEDEAALVNVLAAYVPPPIVDTLKIGQTQVAELKPVVSLFVQFHGLDYDADPHVEQKLQHYFATAQQVVARYHGRLNRLITGDKGSLLHIIFGAPRAVEEPARRAVRCALDLQAECGGLPFISMQRIGLTSGRVFAGPVGSPQRHDYTTMGDAINLSARLMQNAADNQILLDSGVRNQLGKAFDFTDLGAIFVKGKAEPIHVFAVTGYEEAARTLPVGQRIVGRETETAVIQTHLAHLTQGKGGVVTVLGEVGMGKTMLLDSERYHAEQEWRTNPAGGVWAFSICLAYGHTVSGYVFKDILRDLLHLPEGSSPQHTSQRLADVCEFLFSGVGVEEVYPYLAQFMGLPLPEFLAQRLAGLAGESLRWRLFALLPQFLQAFAARYPLVLVVDDLQWIDPTSLQLLTAVLPLAQEHPILFLLGFRHLPDEIVQTLAAVQTAVPPTRLHLQPLSPTQATALVQIHAPQLPDAIVAYLVEKGGGNPLFLVELVRTVRLTQTADPSQLSLDVLNLPDSVQGLLLAQIDRLAVEARQTLQLASVIGRTFLDQVLVHISEAEADIAAHLQELETRDYVRPEERDELAQHTFRHSLIQDSAYSTLLFERRRHMHLQVATAFEQLFPTAVAERASFLAHHYEQAGYWAKAITYLNQTADQARLLYAHEEAQTLYRHILHLLDKQEEADENGRARTYLKLAQVCANQLDFQTAQTYYEQAFALLRQQPTTSPAPSQGAFRWAFANDSLQLDPAFVSTGEEAEILANCFEGLVEIDHEWNVIPALAQRWQVDHTGAQYTFTLWPDLHWSDGAPLTAHDFVFAWRRNLHPQTHSPLAYQLYLLKGAEAYHEGSAAADTLGIQALDDHTVQMSLEIPSPYFPYLLGDPITFPQPAHHIARHGLDWARPELLVGNGPYQPTAHQPGAFLTLQQNRRYAGYRYGNIEQISIVSTPPSLAAYQAQQVDWCRVEDDLALAQDGLVVLQRLATFLLVFGCQHPPFDQLVMRRAVATAVDKELLVQTVWGGLPLPAAGGLIPPGMPGHSPGIALPFQPELARELWATAATAVHEIVLAAFPGFGGVPQFLQQQWAQHLGLSVRIVEDAMPADALADLQNGRIHILLLGLSIDQPDPGILRQLAHSQSPMNYFGWHNPTFDQLVDAAQSETNQETRLHQYRQADKTLTQEDAAAIPLYYARAYGLLRHPFTLPDGRTITRDGAMKFKELKWGT